MSTDKPTRFLVLGTHRKKGGIIVWCGLDGFQPLEQLLEHESLAAQLVNRKTAEEIARESNQHYVLRTVQVRDVTFDRPRIVSPYH